jgi:hypothetical protein
VTGVVKIIQVYNIFKVLGLIPDTIPMTPVFAVVVFWENSHRRHSKVHSNLWEEAPESFSQIF